MDLLIGTFTGFFTLTLVVFEIILIFHIVFFGFNIWMTIDDIRRYQKNNGKLILYLFFIWFLPLGGIIYYFAAVPPQARFVKKALTRHQGKFTILSAVLIILILFSSLALITLSISIRDNWKTRQSEINKQYQDAKQKQERMRLKREEFNENFEKMEDNIDLFKKDINN